MPLPVLKYGIVFLTMCVAVTPIVALGQGGSVKGRVTLAVEVHRRHRSISPYARARYSSPQYESPSGEVVNVVLFIEDHPSFTNLPRPSGSFTIEQRGLTFIPRVLPVPVGASVEFPNNDDVFHNIFSLSSTKRFDLGRYPTGQSRSVKLDKPGIIKVFCDIHAHMSAIIYVLTTPFFTTADTTGGFLLDGIPAGRYLLKAWHETLGEKTVEIVIEERTVLPVEIVFS
jgi:plastocyanin